MAAWYRSGRRPRGRPARKAERGIAARNRRGALGETWWSARFVAVLESFTIGSRLQRGRNYARSGQVLGLEVEPGLVRARVQGSRRTPYDVRIGVKTLSGRAWARVEEALAAQALFAARLLAGEMPHEIEQAFATLDLSLFPARSEEIQTDCSCPDFANPCKHIAATFYILAEAFDADPFLIFAWRGRTRDELVASLRSLRGAAADAGSATGRPAGAEPAPDTPPLAASIGDFWRISPGFTGLHVAPHASDTPDALLRQLGPPPPEAGGQQLLERLASAYHAMASGAEQLAYDVSPGASTVDEDVARAPRSSAEPAPATRRSGGKAHARKKAGDAPRRAARSYVTDMRHFLADDEEVLAPAARRLSAFFGSIVKAGTSIPVGAEVRTPLLCRRVRTRPPCRGRLIVRLSESPSEITWKCAACDEAGVLLGWECSVHDLGGRQNTGKAVVDVTLRDEEYDLLAGLDLIDVAAEQLVRGAPYRPNAIRLAGTREEFDALRAEVASAIKLTRDSAPLRRLLRLLP